MHILCFSVMSPIIYINTIDALVPSSCHVFINQKFSFSIHTYTIDEIPLSSFRPKIEEVVFQERTGLANRGNGKGNEQKGAYANVDGVLSAKLDVNDYLRERKADILCSMETRVEQAQNFQMCEKNNLEY